MLSQVVPLKTLACDAHEILETHLDLHNVAVKKSSQIINFWLLSVSCGLMQARDSIFRDECYVMRSRLTNFAVLMITAFGSGFSEGHSM